MNNSITLNPIQQNSTSEYSIFKWAATADCRPITVRQIWHLSYLSVIVSVLTFVFFFFSRRVTVGAGVFGYFVLLCRVIQSNVRTEDPPRADIFFLYINLRQMDFAWNHVTLILRLQLYTLILIIPDFNMLPNKTIVWVLFFHNLFIFKVKKYRRI